MNTPTLSTDSYHLINPVHYQPFLGPLNQKLEALEQNRITFKNEIHRDSRFAICHYEISHANDHYKLTFDKEKSVTTTNQKKANTNPELLNCESVQSVISQFLQDIGDSLVTRAEVKLIQTDVFPFEFNPHRDSQFWRLRRIIYLAAVMLSCSGIEGGNMQLFHSDNDKLGPFRVIEELPARAGVGYIVDERKQVVFHGMKKALQQEPHAHRAALLIRFFYQNGQ